MKIHRTKIHFFNMYEMFKISAETFAKNYLQHNR